jgi:hypothetical protein
MVIFVRDFYPKRKEDLVCVVREQSVQREKKKKKRKIPPPERTTSFFSSTFLCFKTTVFYYARKEAHIHIYKRIRANNLYILYI